MKYYTQKGEEVKIGEFCTITGEFHGKYYDNTYCFHGILTEEEAKKFVSMGMLNPKDEEEKSDKVVLDSIYTLYHFISDRTGWTYEETTEALANLHKTDKVLHLQYLLRYTAIMLDENYSNHISKSKELYVFDLPTGVICLYTGTPKVWNTVAWFRSLEDIRTACRVLRKFIKEIFCEQKDSKCRKN